MKNFFRIMVIAILTMVIFSSFAFAAKYKDGEYVGVVLDEEHGHVVIAVAICKGYITNVEIINQVKHEYSYEAGKTAYLEYPQKVIAKQAGNIDTVAGATGSYEDYNKALQIALDQAAGTYKGNVYYGLARDYAHGHVVVEVTLNDAKDKIESVRFITANPSEKMKARETLMADKTKGYPYKAGVDVFVSFPKKVVEAQSVNVDGVAGATHSNIAFHVALSNALNAAGALKNFE